MEPALGHLGKDGLTASGRARMKFRFKAKPNVSAARDRASISLSDSRRDTEDHSRQPVSDSEPTLSTPQRPPEVLTANTKPTQLPPTSATAATKHTKALQQSSSTSYQTDSSQEPSSSSEVPSSKKNGLVVSTPVSLHHTPPTKDTRVDSSTAREQQCTNSCHDGVCSKLKEISTSDSNSECNTKCEQKQKIPTKVEHCTNLDNVRTASNSDSILVVSPSSDDDDNVVSDDPTDVNFQQANKETVLTSEHLQHIGNSSDQDLNVSVCREVDIDHNSEKIGVEPLERDGFQEETGDSDLSGVLTRKRRRMNKETLEANKEEVPKKKKGKQEVCQRDEKREDCITAPSSGKKPRRRSLREKKLVNIAPDHSTMTMAELICYNPSANPLKREEKNKQKKNEKFDETAEEEECEIVESLEFDSEQQKLLLKEKKEQDDDRIVPQLKIGEDGNIVLDEGSMLMESSKTDPEEAANKLEVVYENSTSCYGHGSTPKRRNRMKLWTSEETKLFYKSLSQVGTDFTMMTLLVTDRSREDLKKKFKKEEKLHPAKINQALKKRIPLTALAEQ